MRILSLLLVIAVTASAGAMGKRKEMERFIYLDPADTLQVTLTYHADPQLQMRAPTLANREEERRYDYFRKAITPLLETANLPMDYRILEEREQVDRGHPELNVHAVRWEVTDFGELEATIRVTLRAYGEKNLVGAYQERESAAGITSEDRLDAVYVEAMIQALVTMLPELMMHFEPELTPLDPEEQGEVTDTAVPPDV